VEVGDLLPEAIAPDPIGCKKCIAMIYHFVEKQRVATLLSIDISGSGPPGAVWLIGTTQMGNNPVVSDATPRVLLEEARARLARLWFLGAGISFAILTFESILGKYAEDTGQVLSWFVPLVLRTLSLMISILGAGALAVGERRLVRSFFYTLTWWLSLANLLTLLLTIVGASLQKPAVLVLVFSTAWLTPIQGLTVASIGYLFLSKNASTAVRQ
jgi:hypothetical protein